ncbi:MAG: YfhO family protein, partial [Myxococcales bacterium]
GAGRETMGRSTPTKVERPPAGFHLALASMAIVCLALYARQLLGGSTFVLRDHLIYTWPERQILADAVRAGRIPEWNDLVGFGTQFAASSANGVTYPLLWLVAVIPLPLSVDLVIALHVLLSGIGTALFARRLGASALGATFAGAAFMACGYVQSIAPNKVFAATAWIPWVAWATDRVVQDDGDRLKNAGVLAAILGAQVLAGDPASNVTAAIVAAIVAFSRGTRPTRTLRWVAGAYAGAFFLGAAGLLPGLALLPHTTRQAIGMREGALWSLHPWRLVELVWPGFLGNPADPRYNLGELVAASGGGALDTSWSLSAYLGAPVLALAALAAVARRTGSRRLWIGVAILLVLALGAYTPVYPLFRACFPPEQLIRYPEKHVAGALCLLCALAGAGISDLGRVSRAVPWVFGAAIGSLVVPLILLSVLWPALSASLESAGALMVPPVDVEGALALSLRSGVVSFAAAAATSWLFLRSALRPGIGGTSGTLAVVVHVLHAAWEGWTIAPVAKVERLRSRPGLLRSAEAAPALPPPRILRSPALDADVAPDQQGVYRHETLYLDSVARYGFAAVPGFEGWRSREFAALWTRAASVPLKDFLALYAIDYVALPSEMRWRLFPPGRPPQGTVAEVLLSPGTAAPRENDRWALVPTEGVRPRAFVAPRWRWAPPSETLDAVFSPAHAADPGLVVLTGSGPPAAPDRDGLPLSPCGIVSYVPERVELDCGSAAGGYAVLVDEDAPGWTASVDGKPEPVVPADHLLRAVQVPAGRHRVEMTYRTPQLRSGAGISAISWGALILIFCWRWSALRQFIHQIGRTAGISTARGTPASRPAAAERRLTPR